MVGPQADADLEHSTTAVALELRERRDVWLETVSLRRLTLVVPWLRTTEVELLSTSSGLPICFHGADVLSLLR
jgi:hypothetical protein